jgi:hypothetical protein
MVIRLLNLVSPAPVLLLCACQLILARERGAGGVG